MLTSPITITINAIAHDLSRINQDNYQSVYLKKGTDYEFRLVIRHSYEGKKTDGSQMERHNVDFTHTTWDTEGQPVVRQCYMVMRNPRSLSTDDLEDNVAGLTTLINANVAAIVDWES